MAAVFVSHANADKTLVDEFVDIILRNGCGLHPKEIFYSSGADTGVPDGTDLLAHVRHQVDDTGLVVAMLTPTFQTRPVCVAELGAAWATAGKLFPLLAPNMKRSELEGVLSTQLVEYMSDEGALDRLHTKVTESTGRPVEAATWTRAKKRWLQRLREIAEADGIPAPVIVTTAEHDATVAERDSLIEALALVENELQETKRQLEAVKELKDPAEVRAVLLPTKEVDRFETLRDDARAELRALPSPIAQAVVGALSSQRGLVLPDDSWERREVLKAVDEERLIEADQNLFVANSDFGDVRRADEAVRSAIAAAEESTPEFVEWFDDEYDCSPTMSSLAVLKSVFLDD
jgi:hypothetical protein